MVARWRLPAVLPVFALAYGLSVTAATASLSLLKGPYLQQVTESSVVVRWQTSAPSDSQVSFGVTPDDTSCVSEPAAVEAHRVVLTGLAAGTVYHYRITSSTGAESTSSSDAAFQTAPGPGVPLRVAVYGDSRTQPEIHAALAEAMAADGVRLVVHVGDMVIDGTQESAWQQEFFDPAAPLLQTAPFYPSLGNHEGHSALYYAYFDPPDGGGDFGKQWYSFDYGDCHFAVIDTTAGYAPGSAQYQWLVSDLEAAAAEWLFVVEHSPAYSSGAHGGDPNVQASLVPVYEACGVDVVFAGHDHLYERSYRNGVHYLVTGGGGAPLHDPNTTPNPYQEYAEKVYEYCLLDVDRAEAVVRARRADGSAVDTLELAHGPEAQFSAGPVLGEVPLSVQFVDRSRGYPTAWWWDFGDGETSIVQNPYHEYAAAGRYSVALTATSPSGSDRESKPRAIVVTFHDVPAGFPGFDEIMACTDAGVVSGYPGGAYRPDLAVTRDQVAVYLARAVASPTGEAGVPDPGPTATPRFADVGRDHWAFRYVEYCAEQHVVQGYPGGNYQPDQVVSRGQMAVCIARALLSPTGDAALPDPPMEPTFADVAAEGEWSWCYPHVEYAAANGIIQGYADGTYRPESDATRGQVAAYVQRALALPVP